MIDPSTMDRVIRLQVDINSSVFHQASSVEDFYMVVAQNVVNQLRKISKTPKL